MTHRRGQFSEILPSKDKNLIINVSYSIKGVDSLASNTITDSHFNGDTQCFPLYYYEKREKQQASLFDEAGESEHIKRDSVSNFILE